MNKILLISLLLISTVSFSQFITVDETLTTEDLVVDVLIDSPCALVSNFIASTGTDFGDLNGIAAFDATGTDFPFETGIVLTSGYAINVPGPNDMINGDGGGSAWAGNGDVDLANILGIPPGDLTNSSSIQFDFVSFISDVSFNFLLASEEYNQNFECTFSDSFAFILTEQATGISTNLAVIPGTATPIQVTNIREEVPGQCAAVNPEFFDKYNFLPFNDQNLAAIDYNGQTVPLTAQGTVIPGVPYTIKLVVADQQDTAFDVAVFLEGGSFNIGVNLGPDATIVSGLAACDEEEFTIGVLEAPPGSTFQWFRLNPTTGMFDIIPDETNSSLIVTEPGEYQVEATLGPDCTVFDEILVEFAPQPIANIPDKITVCDEAPNDGFASFDLTQANAQIIGTQTDVVVNWFLTEQDAFDNINEIPDDTNHINLVPSFDTVYAKIEDIFRNCFDIVSLDIQVDNAPEITTDISPIVLCDNDENGVETFDLTDREDEIINTLVNVVVEYFANATDAANNTNPIVDPTAFTIGFTTVFVGVTNSLGCRTVGSFDLILGTTPPFQAPFPLIGCDDDGDGSALFDLNEKNEEIEDGTVGLSIRYFPTEATAQNGAEADQLPIPFESTGGVIWVRIEDNDTSCFSITTLTLTVAPTPAIFEPDPLVFCDTDNDGFGEFTLTERDDQVRGGNPSGNLVVSYHETQAEANQNTNALLSPYENIEPFTQIIFARLTNTATGCFSTVPLELIVDEIPVINTPDPLTQCDDDGDGIEEFNLLSVQTQILQNVPPGSTFVINYYETQANADAQFNEIINTSFYPNQLPLTDPVTGIQTIFIVVSNPLTGCSTQTTLDLIVNLQPAINAPAQLILCDNNNPGDEVEEFDLTSTIDEITGGNTNILITFHENPIDAQTGDNPILNATAYENTSNPQNIFIYAEDSTTGCITSTFTLELIVENPPSPETPTPLVVCDENNNGFALFDLTLKDAEIIGGDSSVLISYYETLFDAENATFPIDTSVLYPNLIAFSQTVFARVEFDPATGGLGCFVIVPLELIVQESPIALQDPIEFIACDVDGNGIETFNLPSLLPQILNGQDEEEFTITFHLLEVHAEAGTPQIADPENFNNSTNPQSVFYRIEINDALNVCFVTGEIILEVVPGPVIADPITPFEVCDTFEDINDGIAQFDLTLKTLDITLGNPALNVQYFTLEEDAELNENAINPATSFTNTSNPQVIYIRVEDSNSGCITTSAFQVIVFPSPTPNASVVLELCDDDNTGDEIEFFDLDADATPLITGGTNWEVRYYETEADALTDTNVIVNANQYPNDGNPDVVYALVRNNNNAAACFVVVPVQLIVNPLPDISVVMTDLEECQVPLTNNGVFDLTQKDEEALGATQDPLDFIVTYHLNQADAALGVNPITPATAFSANLNNGPVTIWVGIENITTGCFNGGLQFFDLIFLEGATATDPILPLTSCDLEGDNDGSTSFDLTVLDEEILNGQPSPPFVVTYHESFEEADAGTGDIGPTYVNIINPQTIYARVTNPATGCHDVAQVVLNVEQLPFIELEETYRLCLDANGNPIESDFGEASPPVLEIFLDNASDFTIEWFLDGAVIEGETGTSITAVQGGNYSVTITENATGCSATTQTTVTVSGPPLEWSARLISGAFSGTNDIEVTVEGQGEYQFSLDGGAFQDSNILTGAEPGIVEITIQDINGCGEITFEFGVIDYMRFFTPNQDGFNDLWKIDAILEFDPTANIYIFDRFGKLLKQLSVLSEGWNGTFNGNNLPADDYWFLIEYTEDDVRKEFRTNFSLIR